MITSIKIIVPTLNTYLILPKLINSLKIQTWKDWNLLFVDGDSTKKHFNWIKNLCLTDSRINVIKQDKKFKGIYGAMNQGFKTIKDNELVLFWGSDDWAISPSAFEDVISKVFAYTPVPGGVGPMTVTMLLVNTIFSWQKQFGLSSTLNDLLP